MSARLLKAMSALLAYPTAELVGAIPEIRTLIATDRSLREPTRTALGVLLTELATGDLIDLEERYVDLFDRGRRTSLHLFEHVHGDSRDRGPAMVDLKARYAAAGYALAGHELPDYLPTLLEFAALAPEPGYEMLHDCAHIVRALGRALESRGSAYHAVATAVLDAIGAPAMAPETEAAAPPPEKALDDDWREEEVFFGPPSGAGCAASASAPAVSVMQFLPARSPRAA